MTKRRGGSMPRHIPLRRDHPRRPPHTVPTTDSRGPTKPNLAILTIMWTTEALADPRWRNDVLAMLNRTAVNIHGDPAGIECITCKSPWHARHWPAAIVIAELLPLRLNVLAGICPSCAERPDARPRIYAELERDLKLKTATARPIHPEARA